MPNTDRAHTAADLAPHVAADRGSTAAAGRAGIGNSAADTGNAGIAVDIAAEPAAPIVAAARKLDRIGHLWLRQAVVNVRKHPAWIDSFAARFRSENRLLQNWQLAP